MYSYVISGNIYFIKYLNFFFLVNSSKPAAHSAFDIVVR